MDNFHVKSVVCMRNKSHKTLYDKIPFEHGATIMQERSCNEFTHLIRQAFMFSCSNDNRYELQGSASMQTILLSARMRYGQ